jgi:sec-independent protein translocase protein TatC
MGLNMNNDELKDKTATLREHLAELRLRIMISTGAFLVAFCVCYYFAGDIYAFLVKPLAESYGGGEGRKLIYTGLTEAFFTYVKLAIYAALFITFPIFASQVYIFLAPGLYKNERYVLLPFLIATPVLFLLGASLAYYGIFPAAWKFFISFESLGNTESLPILLEARISEYLSLVISMIIAFGIAFQMPVLLTLLAKTGFITGAMLARNRKYALIIILTVAAFLTPPDVLSQIGLALPMLLLYECSIFSCKWVEKTNAQYKTDP